MTFTFLGGMRSQGFCDDSTRAFVLKSVTMGGGGVKNCVASFMDDPYAPSLSILVVLNI